MNNVLALLIWFGCWAAGGYLLSVTIFRLPRRERLPAGLGTGLVVQTWLANLLSRVLPLPLSFWLAAFLVIGTGLLAARSLLARREWPRLTFPLSQALTFGLLAWVLFAVGRGLTIFDDYQNVPTLSLMATGEIPPRFALDPSLRFGYHYFLLLFAAQVMRLGNLFPWNALDLARGLLIALAILLTHVWVWRMTRSRLAGFLGAVFAAFLGGARWLLLLLPAGVVEQVSAQVTMIGTGAQTAPTLGEALRTFWGLDGAGPIPFPFVFVSGMNHPLVMNHGGTSAMGTVIPLLILLLYRRWRDWRGGAVLTVLIASLALVSEVRFLSLLPTLALAVALYAILHRKAHFPRRAQRWSLVLGIALAIALFQGGVITELGRGFLLRLNGAPARTAYHTFRFSLVWPPSVVSAHLGVLTLTNPVHVTLILLEVGLFLLALPLVLAWGAKMLRARRWWEAMLIAGMAIGAAATFIHYSGTAGISANARLFGAFHAPIALYAFPLTWTWARGRRRGIKTAIAALGLMTIFGGMVTFGIELVAAQKPQLPTFIHEMDARMMKRHWDTLDTDALIFDLYPTRAVTVFGRHTDSHETWYQPKTTWEALSAHPEPEALRAAGFDYFYVGREEWEGFPSALQEKWLDSCARLVDEVTGFRSERNYQKSFRRLYDIRDCR